MTDHPGTIIRELREQAGLSQRALGKAAGVTATRISQIERGTLKPKQAELAALMEALGYPAPKGVSVTACRISIVERYVREAKERREGI